MNLINDIEQDQQERNDEEENQIEENEEAMVDPSDETTSKKDISC